MGPVVDSRGCKSEYKVEGRENEYPWGYALSFAKALSTHGAMHGSWTADELHDLYDDTDVVFVRVWLYGPTGQEGN